MTNVDLLEDYEETLLDMEFRELIIEDQPAIEYIIEGKRYHARIIARDIHAMEYGQIERLMVFIPDPEKYHRARYHQMAFCRTPEFKMHVPHDLFEGGRRYKLPDMTRDDMVIMNDS